MNTLKRFLCALMFLPLISFAALDATYKNVSPACYRAFKTAFGMVPELAADYGYGIFNLKMPMGNPSTYTFTVGYTPSGSGIGDYALYQKHSNNTLYLRLDMYPETFPVEKADQVWGVVGELLKACPLMDQ